MPRLNAPKASNPISRAWCFTFNSPDELYDPETARDAQGRPCLPNGLRYLVYSEESGDSGNHHLQGYCELTRPMRRTGVIELLGLEGAHFEPRGGTRDEAIAYCKKRDHTYLSGPYEWGDVEAGGQGKRSDLAAVYHELKSGKTDLELLESHPATFMRNHRGLSIARALLTPPRTFKTTVYLCYGPPGTGKSRWAMEHFPAAYWKHPTNKWFDTYTGQQDVIWDDFRRGCCPYSELLRLMDRYPLLVETKGGSVQFAPRSMVLTSNSLPEEWYNYNGTTKRVDAVSRRIDHFLYFSDPRLPPRSTQRIDQFMEWTLPDRSQERYFH